MSNNIFPASNGGVQPHQQHRKWTNGKMGGKKAANTRNTKAAGDGAETASETAVDAEDESDHSVPNEEEQAKEEPDAYSLSGAAASHISDESKRLAGSMVRAKEEKEVMTTGMEDMNLADDQALARRLSLTSENSDHDEYNFNMNEDPYLGLNFLDDDYKDMAGRAEMSLWRMPDNVRNREDSNQSCSTQKRVRFEDDVDVRTSRSSSMSSSDEEDEDNAFPDLFMSQDDPLLLQRLALDRDDIDAAFHPVDGSDAGSVWDWDGADEQLAFKIIDEDESDSDDDSDASSDDDSEDDEDGDKTDDEPEEEQIARMEQLKKARASSPSNGSVTPKSSMPPPARAAKVTAAKPQPSVRSTAPGSGKLPRAGTFVIDPTRASMQSSGSKIHTRPPTAPLEKERDFWQRHTSAANSRHSSPRSSFSASTPSREDFPPRPFTTQSTLRTMFGGNLEYLRTNDIPEVAGDFDLISTAPPNMQASFASDTMNDDSDVEVEDINMGDFMHVDDSDSDDDERPPSSSVTSPVESPFYSAFTPSSPSQHRQGANDDLLAHLNRSRGVVGSFRRNQQHARVIGSMASHPAVRASTSEMNALQKGRRAAANTPMTPARKKRGNSQDLGLTGSGVRKAFAAPANSPLVNKSPTRRRGLSLSSMHQPFSPRRP